MGDVDASTSRLTSLDAVRGIAACVVVLGHCYFLMPDRWRGQIENSVWSPLLQPFHNGDAAVVIFFVLSGYVLSLPYFRGRGLAYPRYLIRRICRIYIPFSIAVLLSLFLYRAVGHNLAAAASGWFNTLWPPSNPNLQTLIGHFLMFGRAPDLALDPPMWSLVYEMRISVMFPLLVILCRNTRLAVEMSVVLLVGSVAALQIIGQNNHPAQATTILATLFWSAEIAPYFITGVLLSRHRARLSDAWRRLPGSLRVFFGIGIFLCFAIRPSFARLGNDITYLLAAACLVVSAVEGDTLRRFLDKPIPQWLGRISYSLYLTHLPIMLALFPLLSSRLSFVSAVAVSVLVAFAAAALMRALVEKPAIELGRHLTGSRRIRAEIAPRNFPTILWQRRELPTPASQRETLS